ncbi:MAG: tyrosine-type recombinase/integrase [Dehalococcoidia bacterium]
MLRRLAPGTIHNYRAKLSRYLAHLPTTDDFTEPAFADVMRRYMETHAAGGSRHLYAILRSFTGWLYANKLVTHRMETIPNPKKHLKPPRYLNDEEVALLLDAAGRSVSGQSVVERATLQLIVRLLLTTGLRAGELCALEWRDIEGDVLRIRHGKGDKERVVPLDPAVAALLDARPRGGERIFPFTTSALRSRIYALGRRANLRLWPHLLRHSFACSARRSGADTEDIRLVLGHTNLQMTTLYIAAVNADVAVDRIRSLALFPANPTIAGAQDEDALIKALLANPATKRRLMAALLKEITDA